MKNFFCTLLLILSILGNCTTLFAQSRLIAPTTISIAEVDKVVLPTLDNKVLLEAEQSNWHIKDRAPQFAINRSVFIRPDNRGTWENLPNNLSVWRMRTISAGAKSLNFGFSKFFMPDGAKLIIYSADKKIVLGPFTPADNEEHEQLWTPIIETDDAIIEVQVPTNSIDGLQLQLDFVNHDFIGFAKMASAVASGSCNLDVICGVADGFPIVDHYRDIIQSVAVIGTNGSTFCTGFLVNNARQDCRPFFMTANHCGIDANAAPTLVAYWNYQNSTCRQPNSPSSGGNGDGVLTDFNTGSIFRAGRSATDFTLVELDDPVNESANAFFAGWNATGDLPDTSICIHHPNTDEKRITFDYEQGEYGSFSGGGNTHWHVEWELGVTEPGSSGSPLFNQNKQVIGQLHGGPSSCTASDLSDFYGRFDLSWNGDGTPTTSLKPWLDPDNTGVLQIGGKFATACGYFVEQISGMNELCAPAILTYQFRVSENFTNTVAISTSALPMGITAMFTPSTTSPGDTILMILNINNSVTTGTYSFNVLGNDGTNSSINPIQIQVSNGLPTTPTLTTPSNGATNQSTQLNLSWQATIGASSYEVEVTDPTGTVILTSNNLFATNFDIQNLLITTTYTWRVRAKNGCGMGEWSAPFTFTTGNIGCTTYASTNVPVSINSSDPVTVTSTINVSALGTITDLNILNLVGTHTFLGDLNFSLTSPSGTTVSLVGNVCGSDENFNINFDDAASGSIPCPYNDGGTYPPSSPLSVFNGQEMNGVWTLTIVDDAFGDGGQLQSWSLQICAITLPDLRLNFLQDSFYTCVGENFLTEVSVGEAFNSPVNLTISGYPGITITPASINANQSATISGTMNTPGDYYIVVTANDGTTIISDSVMLHVGQIPSAITTLQTPTNLSTVSPIGLNLTWDAVSGATGYIVEISTDASFATNVFVDSVSSNSVSVSTSLLGNTAYFWRVSVMSECGAGNWSVPFSFITTQVTCTTYTLDSLAIVVGPNPSIATSTIDIPIQGSIVDLNIINLVGTHTFLGDIEIRLTSPNGTTIKLTDNICGSNDNYNVNFDDAAIADPPCPYNDGGTYRPFEALSIFNSQEAIGVWTLTIEDFASGDSGFLNSWGIQICTEPNYNVTIPQNSYSFCIGDSINIPVRVGSAYPGNVNLTMSGYNEVTLSPTTINYVETAHITGLSTTPGTYNLIISGTDGTNSDTTMATIIIGAPPAGIFTLNTPANGATVSQFNPQFSWSAEPNASGYLLEIATNAEFTDVVWAVNVTNTNYVLPIQLQGGAVYFWRLTSINNCGTFISTASTFETSLDLSVAVSPAQLSTCVPFSDTILVQIGEDFNVPVSITIPNAPTGLSYDVIGGVPPGGTATIYLHGTSTALQGNYNLQILVSDNDTSSMSNFVYTLFASAPQPILLSPLNASMFTEGDDLPIFIWNEPSANQILQVSTSPNFSNASIVFRDTLGLVNNYTFVENPFEVDVTYYWRIVPVSSCPVMPSAPYSFTIGASSGVADLAENKFNIYPNPTSDIVQIRFEQPISELTTIQLFDVNGRLLQSKKVDQGSFTTLSLENLTNGVYYLKISTSAWITSKRVILQK